VKKKYTAPKLVAIGDMVHNTLGASGTIADNGTFQAGANGAQAKGAQNNGNNKNFNNDNFNNNGF